MGPRNMTGQPGSSLCPAGYPYLAASLHSADRSASTLLLVVIGEWWWGHPPVPVKIPYYIITTTHIFKFKYSSVWCVHFPASTYRSLSSIQSARSGLTTY